LIPSTTHHLDSNNLQDPAEFSDTIVKTELEFHEPSLKRKGRLLAAKKRPEQVDFDSLLRHRLTKDGYTAKELKTLKWTGRYSFTIEKQQEKDRFSLLKGPFTEEETDILKKMYEDGIHPRIIADRLGRKEPSVKAKVKSLAPYFQNRNEPLLFHGPQVLAPELEDSIFHWRLSTIWEGLMAFPKTLKWDETLSKFPSEFWLSQIVGHTPRRLKSLLVSHQPPDIAQLGSLDWSETASAGVYGWILTPKWKSDYFDKECYLYVGSASQYDYGLSGTRYKHLSTWPSRRNDPPEPDIRDLGLSPRGKFITLFEVPFKDGSSQEIRRIRTLVTLARAVFVVWLGAVKESSKPAIKELNPWELECIHYRGLASHNPLAKNIRDPQ
jgi:hypothetical protein